MENIKINHILNNELTLKDIQEYVNLLKDTHDFDSDAAFSCATVQALINKIMELHSIVERQNVLMVEQQEEIERLKITSNELRDGFLKASDIVIAMKEDMMQLRAENERIRNERDGWYNEFLDMEQKYIMKE